jgi:hypothetical protein
MFGAAKPDSKIKGVQIGTITYSYGSMHDQSAEATLGYVVDSGISAIELMGGPVNDWARKKGNFDSSPAAAAAAAGGGGRGGGRGGSGGRGGGRGPAQTYPVVAGMKVGFPNDQPAGQWNGVACPANAGRGGGGAAGGSGGRGGGGGGRGPQTPEQTAAADAERKWRLALPMSIFKDLRTLYNNAGVSI